MDTKLTTTETLAPGAPDPPESESEGVCAQALQAPPTVTTKAQIRKRFMPTLYDSSAIKVVPDSRIA